MFFDSTLSLFHIAAIFIPLKLKRTDFFLGPTSKLQLFLPVPDQLDNTAEGDLVVSAVMEVSNREAPASQYAFCVASLLVVPILLLLQLLGESRVVEGIGFVDLGEMVCEKGVVHT